MTTYRRFLCIYVNDHKDWAVGLENSINCRYFSLVHIPPWSSVTRSTTTSLPPCPARPPARGEAALSVPVVEGVAVPPESRHKMYKQLYYVSWVVRVIFRCGCINKRVIVIWSTTWRPSPGYISNDAMLRVKGRVTEVSSSRIMVKFDLEVNIDGWWQMVTCSWSNSLVLHVASVRRLQGRQPTCCSLCWANNNSCELDAWMFRILSWHYLLGSVTRPHVLALPHPRMTSASLSTGARDVKLGHQLNTSIQPPQIGFSPHS